MFSEQELAFLRAQPLAGIATVDNDEQPTVDAVGFEFDGTRFYIGAHQLETTRKYKNIAAGHRKVSLIIDDLIFRILLYNPQSQQKLYQLSSTDKSSMFMT